MHRLLLPTVACAVFLTLSLCAKATPLKPPPVGDLECAVAELSNEDIQWQGNWLGLWPEVSPRAEAIVSAGPSATPYLLKGLDDARRYVVAHVLLTLVSGEFCLLGSEFNGLRVNLWVDRTEIPDQRDQIGAAWLTNQHPIGCFALPTKVEMP